MTDAEGVYEFVEFMGMGELVVTDLMWVLSNFDLDFSGIFSDIDISRNRALNFLHYTAEIIMLIFQTFFLRKADIFEQRLLALIRANFQSSS